jgi:glycosyltransferase involved in cell wall biosynthesis
MLGSFLRTYGAGASALLAYRASQLANSLALSVLVARRLGLEMVGTFAVGFIAVAVVALVAPVGLNSQLPRVRQPHARLCCAGLVLLSLQWPAVLLLLYVYSGLQAQSPAEAQIIFLVALNGPLLALINVGITLSIIQKKESNAVIGGVAETAGVIGAIVSAHTGEALAVWVLSSRCLGCLLIWSRFRFSWLSWPRIVCIGRRSVSYVVPEILSLAADQSGPLMLTQVVPRAELGVFRLCQQLLNAADAPVVAFVQARYPTLVRATGTVWGQTLHRVTQLAAIAAPLCLASSMVLAWTVYRIPRLAPMMAVLSMSLLWRYRVHFYEEAFRAAGLLRLVWVLNGVKPLVFAPVFYFLISRYQAWGAVWAMALLTVAVETTYRSAFRRQALARRPVEPNAPSTSTASPLVSVVITAYNVGPFISQAVASVLRQTYIAFEVIVVDDGSTDDTSSRLKVMTDPRLRVIDKDNGGVSSARNAGIRTTRGRYVALLDGDDYWEPRLLERLVSYLEQHPEADVVHSFARIVSEHGVDTGRVMASRPGPSTLHQLLISNIVNASTVVARRDALLAAGEFDATLRAGEDHDQWIRVALLRANNIHCIPEILACYRTRAGQMTRDWRTMQNGGTMVLDKAAGFAPAAVRSVRREAEAHMNRYLGLIAFETGDHRQAWRFLVAAFRKASPSLLRDRRTWFLAIAVGSRLVMPACVHHRLYSAYRRSQAAFAHIT